MAQKSAAVLAAGGDAAIGLACDVTKYDQVEAVVKAVVENGGKLIYWSTTRGSPRTTS